MRLQDFAKQSRYLNWNESDSYNISLSLSFEDFCELPEISSDKFDSNQFEIPIFVIDGKEVYESILATKSKVLLSECLAQWSDDPERILRVFKKGSGFYTKYTVTASANIYDKASGKILKKAPK